MQAPLRIGGVPEHFNLPVHLARERGDFAGRGVAVEWITFAGGTGQMCAALREDEADLCILLTEGIVRDIILGNPSKIISTFVASPLTWGIHTGAGNPLTNYSDIFTKRYAVSRIGSGSHLMAIVDANGKGHELKQEQFTVIKDLAGALASLERQETDVFYWEKFMTKPHVDAGRLRRIGEFLTPWPCFVIAATDRILAERPKDVIRLLRTLHDSNDRFMQDEHAIAQVSERYDLQYADAERWYHGTEWAIHGWVSDKMLRAVIYSLRVAGIIDKNHAIPELIWRREEK